MDDQFMTIEFKIGENYENICKLQGHGKDLDP